MHLPTFLQQKLEPKKGSITEIPVSSDFNTWQPGLPDNDISDDELKNAVEPHDLDRMNGKFIGTHNGAHFYTIGQRKGINIGGYKEPLFVIGIDIAKE